MEDILTAEEISFETNAPYKLRHMAYTKSTFTVQEFMEELNKGLEEKKERYKKFLSKKSNKEIENTLKFLTPRVDSLELVKEIIEKQLEGCNQFNPLIDFELVGDIFRIKQYKPIKFKLEVPSGAIVADDYLRDVGKLEKFDSIDFYVNSIDGKIKTTLEYAKHKMAHGFVGNSCPTLYWDEKSKELHVGAERKKIYEDYPEAVEEDDYDIGDPINKNLKEVGYICTDLWWYSFMDKNEYLRLGGKLENASVIEIPAGTYEFEHFYGITQHDWDNQTYAIARKID